MFTTGFLAAELRPASLALNKRQRKGGSRRGHLHSCKNFDDFVRGPSGKRLN